MISVRNLKGLAVVAGSVFLLASCNNSCGGSSFPTGTPVYPAHGTTTPTTPTAAGALAWSISPIDAAFSQNCFCTDYQVNVSAPNVIGSNNVWQVTWRLNLTLVDPVGSSDPSDSGSSAAVDTGCNNNGKGTPYSFVQQENVYSSGSSVNFIWYHPDASSSVPGIGAGVYHCDHSKQGPHGHQGVITATFKHGAQTCTVSFDGTHTGKSSDPGQPGNPSCYGN